MTRTHFPEKPSVTSVRSALPDAKPIERRLVTMYETTFNEFGGSGAPYNVVLEPESERVLASRDGRMNGEQFLEKINTARKDDGW